MSRLLQTIAVQGQVCAGMGSGMYGDVLRLVAGSGHVFAARPAGRLGVSGPTRAPRKSGMPQQFSREPS
jgi:hypothetical protein